MTDGWQDILHPGERVLWQGQPDGRVRFNGPQMPFALFGIIFAGFAVFWMVMAARSGGFWVFGLIHFFAGIVVALAPSLIGPYIANHTWYSLTNQRAFIATQMPFAGRELNAVDLRPSLGLDFDGRDPGTIAFHAKALPVVGTRTDSRPRFSQIPDARTVFALIRDIQKGTA
nr:aspartate carbamoyltransferase catalytic subunit [uncultured Celeribacter sp.]